MNSLPWPPIPPIWRGETAYVIGGGPSFADLDAERLRGRRLVVVNSSWVRCPWAGVLFFGDDRFWRYYRQKIKDGFRGKILTTTQQSERPLIRLKNSLPRRKLGKPKPPLELSRDPCSVPMRRTSLVPAINIAAHLIGWSGRIVLLGADGKRHKDGRSHHHAAHPWPVKMGCWDIQKRDLIEIAPQLNGVEVLNASPGSAWDVWPIVQPDEVL